MAVNKRMVTLEDVNSILCHFAKGFTDYYVIDTADLVTEDTWFAYDFIDIYRVSGSISFSIRNSLWTGGYKILDCNINDYNVEYTSEGYLVVSGSGLESVKLLLELSPEFKHNNIFELDYEIEYTPIIRPFYENTALTMGFLNNETPISNMNVEDKITGETLTTDNDGLVTVSSQINKAGDYDYVLECTNNSEIVDYNFPYQRIQCELPVKLINNNVFREKVNILEFMFLFDDEYNITESMLFDNNDIRLKVDGVDYEIKTYSDNIFSFEVPVNLSSYIDMKLIIQGNEYIDNYSVDFNVATSFVTVSTGSDLKSELESDVSASTVIFDGAILDTEIIINKNINLLFEDNVVSSSLDSVFTVVDNAELSLSNINFVGKSLVILDEGNVNVLNCSFTHSFAPLFVGNGNLTVKDSSFIDNYSCIDVDGDVDLYNTLFDLSDTEYLDTSNPAFVKCYNNLTVDFCRFNLDLHGLDSLGLSYVMLLLGKNGNTNEVSNNELLDNEIFPVKKNTCNVDVESEHYHITSKSSKCMIWTVQDTNTVYSNQLEVEYVQ